MSLVTGLLITRSNIQATILRTRGTIHQKSPSSSPHFLMDVTYHSAPLGEILVYSLFGNGWCCCNGILIYWHLVYVDIRDENPAINPMGCTIHQLF
ncbi:MAG: hypothetical protein ACK4K0_04645 [Flavobacteriales bacterium]